MQAATTMTESCMTEDKNALKAKTALWYLYPCETRQLSIGDLVYIRSKSAKPGKRGRVVQVLQRDERALLRLEDSEHETNVALKRCIPVYSTSDSTTSTIILTRETHPYRHLAASQITLADRVLEIGCSTGEASSIMLKSSRDWLGLDISSEMVQQTNGFLSSKGCNVPNRVHRLDVLMDPNGAERLIRQHFSTGPSVIFIDIGGNRDISSAIRVLYWCISTFTPRLVVVKNREMVDEYLGQCPVDKDGMLQGAHDWFEATHATIHETLNAWPEHPLQACMVLSPVDGTTPICRYHNYHALGCKKAKSNECPFAHDHCHWCRKEGHTAKECPMREA